MEELEECDVVLWSAMSLGTEVNVLDNEWSATVGDMLDMLDKQGTECITGEDGVSGMGYSDKHGAEVEWDSGVSVVTSLAHGDPLNSSVSQVKADGVLPSHSEVAMSWPG